MMPSPSTSQFVFVSGIPSLLKSYGIGSAMSGTPSRSVSATDVAFRGGACLGFSGVEVPLRSRPKTSAYRKVEVPLWSPP